MLFKRGFRIEKELHPNYQNHNLVVKGSKVYDMVIDPYDTRPEFQVYFRSKKSNFVGLVTGRDCMKQYPQGFINRGLYQNDRVLDICTGLSNFAMLAAETCKERPVVIDFADYEEIIKISKAALLLLNDSNVRVPRIVELQERAEFLLSPERHVQLINKSFTMAYLENSWMEKYFDVIVDNFGLVYHNNISKEVFEGLFSKPGCSIFYENTPNILSGNS